MMHYKLTARQRQWFDGANRQDRLRFLAQGPAEVPPMISNKTHERVFRPMVRGFLISDQVYPSYDAALEAANAELAIIKKKAGSKPLDERSLCIDDVYRSLDERLSECMVRIDWVVPILGLDPDALPEQLTDFLEDLTETDLKRLEPTFPRFVECYREREKDDDEERPYGMLPAEMFVDNIQTDSIYGVFIRVSQPVPRNKRKDSVMFSWGYTSFTTLFAETFEAACEAAIEWGKRTWSDAKTDLPDEAADVEPVGAQDE